MHVSEGPGSIPEISSKANPQDFLLNPGQNQVASQDPFGQSKQPTLKIQTASQLHVGLEKLVDGGQQKRPLEHFPWSGISEGNPGLTLHQNMAPKGKTVQSQDPIEDCDELYASSPLVHEEKVTGCHHPYASKQKWLMPVHQEKKLWMMSMRTCLRLKVKQMMNQGGTISWHMRRELSQIVSSPTLKCPVPRVGLINMR
ncbi:hypothetical protein O181_031652 [Austropuccinia psidii MF-1]|uniref:Uncharacterized protein n=1 Tax=Austropuccinia psidii MF-1 TaxID=1389203 RepID=A0A9Q3H5J3_9BASI|nr:hypothetical protein [Austropuccinia psidii MF-1]